MGRKATRGASKLDLSLTGDTAGAGGLRHGQAEGIVMEFTALLMQRFDVIRQGLWDGDSSTIFIP